MSGFKEPNFADRQKAALQAKQNILNKFRAQPGPDDPEVKRRQAEREAQAAARAKAREAREAAKAEQEAREAEAAGFDQIWLGNDIFDASGVVALSAIAAATSALLIPGPPPPVRGAPRGARRGRRRRPSPARAIAAPGCGARAPSRPPLAA